MFTRMAHILLPHDYLTSRLTGEYVTDRGDASGTGYWSARDEREIHANLEIGRLASHVVIGKGAQVRFIKRIAVGADHLADAVSRRLGIPREDAANCPAAPCVTNGRASGFTSLLPGFLNMR